MPSVWSRLKTFAHRTKGTAGWSPVVAQHHLPGFVPLFENLVVDDRRGSLALPDMAAKVQGLFEGIQKGDW